MYKVSKAENKMAIIMLYKRLREKDAGIYIKDNLADTPYEFAVQFEDIFGYDISAFVYLVEKSAYRNEEVSNQDKQTSIEIYRQIKSQIKEYKKNNKRKR